MDSWMTPGTFLGAAALLTSLAAFYGHRVSSRSSSRSATIQERVADSEADDRTVHQALAIAERLETEVGQLRGRVKDLEEEREDLLALLDAVGVPRTPQSARRQRRRSLNGDGEPAAYPDHEPAAGDDQEEPPDV